jgi:hypothetical protein
VTTREKKGSYCLDVASKGSQHHLPLILASRERREALPLVLTHFEALSEQMLGREGSVLVLVLAELHLLPRDLSTEKKGSTDRSCSP